MQNDFLNIFRQLKIRQKGQEILLPDPTIDFKPGNLVGVYNPDPLIWAITFLKVLKKGGVPVALAEPGQKIESVPSLYQNCYACMTSGTTGEPKLIYLGIEGALANAKAHAEGFGLSSDSAIIQTLPVYHSYGIVAYIFTPVVLGCSVDFYDRIMGLSSIKSPHENSVVHVSPAQARSFLKEKNSVHPNIRKVSVGAGTLAFEEWEKLLSKYPDIEFYTSYGLTEAGPRVTAGKITNETLRVVKNQKGLYIGKGLKGVTLKVNHSGLLCVQSASLLENKSAVKMDGQFLVTRDHVEIDNKDQVFFIEREGDIIKYSGMTLYPSQIEQTLRKDSRIQDCILLKKKDVIYDELPLLFVEGDLAVPEVQDIFLKFYSEKILPRFIKVLKKFPRTSLNKIDRKELLAMAQ